MANEISVQCSLKVRTANGLDYQSRPTAFTDNMVSIQGGPSLGLVQVSNVGTYRVVPTFTDPPGWCRLQNMDLTNTVEVGAYNPDITAFIPLLELLPGGKPQILFLSRYLGHEWSSAAGSADISTGVRLAMRALNAPCYVLIELFPR